MNGHTTAKVRELPPDSALVKRRWLLDNGAQEVELHDASEAEWQRYCAERVQTNAALAKARGGAA